MNKPFVLAQISDLHLSSGEEIYGRIHPDTALTRVVDVLNAQTNVIDVIIITGDLAQSGEEAAYDKLKTQLTRLTIPYLLLLGNHDNRKNFLRFFPQPSIAKEANIGEVCWICDSFPLNLIGLDTWVENESYGFLSEASLQWLDTMLKNYRKPTLIALHHPPFDTHIRHMDDIRLKNSDALANVVMRHPHVVKIICGHDHRFIQTQWHGIATCVAPAIPGHQVTLDVDPSAPSTFTCEPPAFLLHLYKKDNIVTHLSYVEKFPGPYYFRPPFECAE